MSTTWFDGSYPPSVLFPPATGATAGSPGAWTPEGSRPPANLAEANALGYSGPAWTVGQYVVLGDESEAYWSGTAFVAGRAPADDVEGARSTSSRKRKTSEG